MPGTRPCRHAATSKATPIPFVYSDAWCRPPGIGAASPLANTPLGLLQLVCWAACCWSATPCLISRHKLLCSGPGVWTTVVTGKNKWNNNTHHSATQGCDQTKETVGQFGLWVLCEELGEAKPRRLPPRLWFSWKPSETKLFTDNCQSWGKPSWA